jgi:hypothetical protein
MIVDCHVNIWEERHLTPLFAEQMAHIRPGGMGSRQTRTRCTRRCRAWTGRSCSRCATAIRPVESDDATTAAAVAKHPDKFVGFAYADPRRPDRPFTEP